MNNTVILASSMEIGERGYDVENDCVVELVVAEGERMLILVEDDGEDYDIVINDLYD